MKYDFDKVHDRNGTNSIKWDFTETYFGEKDILPMWVADMDFRAPEPVVEAIAERARHGIYGYAGRNEDYYSSILSWLHKRHGWEVQKDWLLYSPGVVPALNWLVRAFTKRGDKVIVQTPVYYPFYNAIKNNGCEIVRNPLKNENGRFVMDLEDLEKKFDGRVKLLFLCNPQNPIGRVWTREELVKLGELCIKHDVTVVSDEIHSDLIYRGHKHIPFASISEEFAQNSITCIAPSKTFNIAGLQMSSIIIPNRRLRNSFFNEMESNGIFGPNLFGIIASEAAYKYGEEWLEQLIDYLQGNRDYLISFLEKNIPEIKVVKPEGTYLVWLDCRALGMNSAELKEFMTRKAGVALEAGAVYGDEGEGFARMNIGCPRALLEDGLKRLEKAVKAL